MTEIVFLAPLLILPGIGLLLVSTSARFASLHDEIHHWTDDEHDREFIASAHLFRRAQLFRNALVSLYLCVFTFALASLVGAVVNFAGGPADVAVFLIASVGIICLGFASVELVMESLLSLQVIESHLGLMMPELMDDEEQD